MKINKNPQIYNNNIRFEGKDKTKKFMSKLNSEIDFNSELDSVLNSLEWLEEIEKACPYIDNIVRRPRVALVSETEVHKIERAKKITVESIKDLAKHTNYIEKVDEVTKDVKPSKILVLSPPIIPAIPIGLLSEVIIKSPFSILLHITDYDNLSKSRVKLKQQLLRL